MPPFGAPDYNPNGSPLQGPDTTAGPARGGCVPFCARLVTSLAVLTLRQRNQALRVTPTDTPDERRGAAIHTPRRCLLEPMGKGPPQTHYEAWRIAVKIAKLPQGAAAEATGLYRPHLLQPQRVECFVE